MSLNQKKLTKEIKNIRKFARYGLIYITPHARERMSERDIDESLIQSALTSGNTRIVQDRPAGSHNDTGNFDRYVIHCDCNDRPFQVVIEKGFGAANTCLYRLITCYTPDSGLFRKDGTLKKKQDRKSLDARTKFAPAP